MEISRGHRPLKREEHRHPPAANSIDGSFPRTYNARPTALPGPFLSKFAFDKVEARFPEAIVRRYDDSSGGHWAVVRAEHVRAVATFLKNDPELDYKLFLSADAVDRLYLPESDPRFEVVYFLRSLSRNDEVRMKVQIAGDKPEQPSLPPVYQGANWW